MWVGVAWLLRERPGQLVWAPADLQFGSVGETAACTHLSSQQLGKERGSSQGEGL